jgi:hypothetical protein
MKAHELCKVLGGDCYGNQILMPGPDHRPFDRSLSVLFDPSAPDGFLVYSFAGDDRALCRAYVKERLKKLASGSLVIEADTSPVDASAQEARIAAALKIWEAAQPAQGTIVETYLDWRGCPLTPTVIATDMLRFHPLCPFGGDRAPAMVAWMTDVLTGAPVGVHRTALADDGLSKRVMSNGRPCRMMMGRAKDAVVRFGDITGGCLGLSEGLETALSAAKIFKVSTWAALSANGMACLPIIPGVKSLTIFADHDAAGISAARECKRRYKKAGIEVEVRYPLTFGDDWNDHARKEASHGNHHKENEAE